MKIKLFAILLIVIMMITLSSCKPEETEITILNNKEKPVVAMVADVNGFGYNPFNDAALAGLEKAKLDFGIDIVIFEPVTVEEYEETMQMAVKNGADLVLTRGLHMADATKLVAEANPEVKFAIFDFPEITGDNIISAFFNEQEGSFLMGIIAAMTTKTEIVGFIGGMQFPIDERYEYGFKAGVMTINPEIEVLTDYIGSYSDESLSKISALKQHENGADVIYHSTDLFGTGIIEAAEEQGFWALGVGKESPVLKSSAVLVTLTKEIDKAIYLTVKELSEGSLEAGRRVYGIADEGIQLLDSNENLSAEVLETLEDFKEKVRRNNINVPYDLATFEKFEGIED